MYLNILVSSFVLGDKDKLKLTIDKPDSRESEQSLASSNAQLESILRLSKKVNFNQHGGNSVSMPNGAQQKLVKQATNKTGQSR